MPEEKTFHCNTCRKPKPFVKLAKGKSRLCTSCGTPFENAVSPENRLASVMPKAKRKAAERILPCPECRAKGETGQENVTEIEPGRFHCRICGSTYEPDDFSSVDTRPDINFEKQHERGPRKVGRKSGKTRRSRRQR